MSGEWIAVLVCAVIVAACLVVLRLTRHRGKPLDEQFDDLSSALAEFRAAVRRSFTRLFRRGGGPR